MKARLKPIALRFACWRAPAALHVLFCAMAVPLCAGSIKNIAISAIAVPKYVRPTDAQGKPLPETYVFSRGKFFGGDTADTRLAQVKFEDLTKMLATNLAKQNYFPTKDLASANLVLMVHWGTTQVEKHPENIFASENLNKALNDYRNSAANNSGDADPGALNDALNEQAYAAASAHGAIARNSALLGYKPTLQREQNKIIVSTDEMTMSAELNEERYFIIVMAYDYQYMQKEHKSRLLWVTRISVRSSGNNFTEAVPAIAEAGASVYGRQVDGLVRVDASDRGGRVDFGEMKVLGPVETKEPVGKKK